MDEKADSMFKLRSRKEREIHINRVLQHVMGAMDDPKGNVNAKKQKTNDLITTTNVATTPALITTSTSTTITTTSSTPTTPLTCCQLWINIGTAGKQQIVNLGVQHSIWNIEPQSFDALALAFTGALKVTDIPKFTISLFVCPPRVSFFSCSRVQHPFLTVLDGNPWWCWWRSDWSLAQSHGLCRKSYCWAISNVSFMNCKL